MLFPGAQRPGDGERVQLPAGEADVGGDLLPGFDQGDVGDQQADQAFAFPHRGGGVVEQGGEVCRERADPGLLLVGEGARAGVLRAVVLVLGVCELAQFVVPVGLELVGDEPVGGVNREVAPAGGVGGVLGALHAAGADLVGVCGALGELG